MRIKQKQYAKLLAELQYYKKACADTRIVIEVPGQLGPEASPDTIPPMVPIMDVNLEHMILIARFGGYENHAGEVLTGPFAIRFVTDDPASGYEHFMYHRYMKDGRTVITTDHSWNVGGYGPDDPDSPFRIIDSVTLTEGTDSYED